MVPSFSGAAISGATLTIQRSLPFVLFGLIFGFHGLCRMGRSKCADGTFWCFAIGHYHEATHVNIRQFMKMAQIEGELAATDADNWSTWDQPPWERCSRCVAESAFM